MKKIIKISICLIIILTLTALIPLSSLADSKPTYVFAIDAGHGGSDPGATGIDGRYEANDTIRVANIVTALLKGQGQKVYSPSRAVGPKYRAYEVNEKNVDFFLSIHRDSNKSSSANGFTVYTHDPTHEVRKHKKPDGSNYEYMPNEYSNKHTLDDKMSSLLVQEISAACPSLKSKGRYFGSAAAPTYEDYYINGISNMPSCIVELGFVSNANDNAIFDNNVVNLSVAITKALLKTAGLPVGDDLLSGMRFLEYGEGDWFYNAAEFVIAKKYITGYSSGYFGPTNTIQRQDFALVLARIDGADLSAYNHESTFGDIPASQYYTSAVNWAKENGIINGYSDSVFGLGNSLTREELVTIFYNYAQYKGKITSVNPAKAQAMTDFNLVSDWAKVPVEWAIDKGVISGQGGIYISPNGKTLRCELAQILYNISNNSILDL